MGSCGFIGVYMGSYGFILVHMCSVFSFTGSCEFMYWVYTLGFYIGVYVGLSGFLRLGVEDSDHHPLATEGR